MVEAEEEPVNGERMVLDVSVEWEHYFEEVVQDPRLASKIRNS